MQKNERVFEGKKKKGANYRLLLPCHLPVLFLLINELMALVNIIRNACTVGVRKFWLCGIDRRGKSARPQLLMGTPCFWFFKYNPRDCVNRRISAVLKSRKETIMMLASIEMLTGLEMKILKSF